MLALHPDIFEEDNRNCCYLCNECPQNFATFQQLQRHLSENHKTTSDFTSGINMEITEKSSANLRNSFEEGNISISEIDTKIESVPIHRNLEAIGQDKIISTQKAMFLETLQNGDSSFPTVNNRFDEAGFRREDVSCLNSPTTSDFSSAEASGIPSTQMEYEEEEEELDVKYAALQSETDLPELKLDGHNSPSTPTESILKLNGKAAAQISRRYACTKCDRVFARRDELNIHYTHTHRERPRYTCDVCEQVFMVKRDLSTHARIHNGEQPQRCDVCGKEYGTRQLLKKHSMVHTGVRSHFCPICPRAFYQKGHLTQHMHIHTGKRSHKCQLCVKTFIFKFDLNRHMKIHAERGGNSCRKCGKNFPKQSTLDDHVLKCKKRCEAKGDMDQHSSLFKHRQVHSPDMPINLIKANYVDEKIDSATGNSLLEKLSPQFLPNSPNENVETGSKFFNKNEKPLSSPLGANWTFLNSQNAASNLPFNLNPRFLAIQNFASLLISAAAARNSTSKFNFPNVDNNSVGSAANFAKLIQQKQQLPPAAFAQNLAPPQTLLNFVQGARSSTVNGTPTQNFLGDGAAFLNSLVDQKSTLPKHYSRQNPHYYCFLCAKDLENQPAYLLHWSTIHLSGTALAQKQQPDQSKEQPLQTFKNDGNLHIKCEEKTESSMDNLNSALFLNTKLIQGFLRQNQNLEDFHCVDSATTSSSSCASSPQKVSPVCYAAGGSSQPVCETDLRNQCRSPITNSLPHCSVSTFSQHRPATFDLDTSCMLYKNDVEKVKNSHDSERRQSDDGPETIYNLALTPAPEINVDDIIELDDPHLEKSNTVNCTDSNLNKENTEHANSCFEAEDQQCEMGDYQKRSTDAAKDRNTPVNHCSRCVEACTRECILERELNAARDEIMRLRDMAQRLGTLRNATD